jgi:2'-5' RNA ligase
MGLRADHTAAMLRANWFIGIPVPGDAIMSRVPAVPPGITRFAASDLHLTVAFLGACGEERARAGWDALALPLAPLSATLAAVVPMGPERRWSALSALLDEGRAAIESAIGAARDAACEAAGAPIDTRPPKAHVTIARPARSATDADRRAALRWAEGIDLSGLAVHLDEVALFTWSSDRRSSDRRSPDHSARLFERVATRALGPRAGPP